MKTNTLIGNHFGVEGTRIVSELLKTNSSLMRLDLSCELKDER